MTLTPEERAKAVVEECRGYDIDGDDLFIACDRAERIITQAIRQAQNDKMEEAAREFERRDAAGGQIGVPDDLLMSEAGRSAKIVRSLISNEPGDLVETGMAAFESGLNSKKG